MTTWLITGCSSGLGHAIATAVLDAGFNAIVTARSADKVTKTMSPTCSLPMFSAPWR